MTEIDSGIRVPFEGGPYAGLWQRWLNRLPPPVMRPAGQEQGEYVLDIAGPRYVWLAI
ncbi:hypothetical protein OG625_20915 [Streptomyces sp. NBC_01351]|uniref:hypothetical protein n=1 Tax=unclassified Streptomyces TaxID=2593676 RepID=UPI002E35C2E0|nr:hypothetical protein [Streptomyces sp. NBC_01351]